MKLIPLGAKRKTKYHGKYFAQVDDEDYDYLMQWDWYPAIRRHTVYAARTERLPCGKSITIMMHREIFRLSPDDKRQPDHIDKNGLNDQKFNMRLATPRQNSQYRKSLTDSTSKYLGVYLKRRSYTKNNGVVNWYEKWVARIKDGDTVYNLGHFDNEEDAARAYDKKAFELFGEFANLNFK